MPISLPNTPTDVTPHKRKDMAIQTLRRRPKRSGVLAPNRRSTKHKMLYTVKKRAEPLSPIDLEKVGTKLVNDVHAAIPKARIIPGRNDRG